MRTNPGAFKTQNITTATTTTLKTGNGILHSLVCGNTGTTWVATVYDNTAGSGTKIGTFSLAAGQSLVFDAEFSTGLTIVTTGTPGDLTVNYA